jgi:hypothetical protein
MSRTQLALDSALELAEQGKTSFPCNWFSKAPTKPKARGGQGYKDATEDPAALRKFWKEFPGGLVGVPTGETNGFDVLDIDPKHAAAREWWSETRDALLPTRAHRTRTGGLHLLFTHAPGIKCSASKIAQGVDIRTSGGYIIWWPAAGFPVLNDAPLADLPSWLHRLLLPPPPRHIEPHRRVVSFSPYRDRRALRGLIRTVATAIEGERNAITFWAACRAAEMIADGNLSESEAVAELTAAAAYAGLSEQEAIRTIHSGLGAQRK